VIDADLVIGAVLVPGAKAPELISDELVSRMKSGLGAGWTSPSTRVAVFAGSRPTTHRRSHLPGCTTRCSTAWPTCPGPCRTPRPTPLTNVTPALRGRAGQSGLARTRCAPTPALALGLHTHEGSLTCQPVADRARAAVPAAHRGAQLTPAGSVTVNGARVRRYPSITSRWSAAWPCNTLAAYRRDLPPLCGDAGRTRPDGDRRRHHGRCGGVSWPGCAKGDDDHSPLAASSAGRAVVAVRGPARVSRLAEGLASSDPASPGAPARQPRGSCPARSECRRWSG